VLSTDTLTDRCRLAGCNRWTRIHDNGQPNALTISPTVRCKRSVDGAFVRSR